MTLSERTLDKLYLANSSADKLFNWNRHIVLGLPHAVLWALCSDELTVFTSLNQHIHRFTNLKPQVE